MNVSAIRRLREKLRKQQPVFGMWVTLPSASITEMAVGMGLDWVVIDAEHGQLDWGDIIEHLRATARSETVALVRLAELNGGLIKRALDVGADGVVIPWMESAEQLRTAVEWASYPPKGRRGIGAERATCWGQCFTEHIREANDNVLVVPIIESVKGGENLKQMLQVPGVDLFIFGPADYSSSAGFAGQWEGPGIAEKLLAHKDEIRAAGKACGLITTSTQDLAKRVEQKFQFLGIGIDSGMILGGIRSMLTAVDKTLPQGRVEGRPSESFRPDRPEIITLRGQAPVSELASGVKFQCFVGAHNQSRGLTTGIVTFDPGAKLPYHEHAFGESITLLSGRATIEVEGRMYTLDPLDNVTIPRGLAHAARNPSDREPAVLHIAMASSNPTRQLVDRFFSQRAMPRTSTGQRGAEHVVRPDIVEHYQAGPNADFVDYCNSQLLPGIEMSGGWGRFMPGGRLPAHYHDFDESICIIEGEAECIVEGRRYTLGSMSTALEPRGRIHYFRNTSTGPMAMIWFYAGPVPERKVVDESLCTVEGNPWR
jgi:2-keto-3-deoxy-L-rhamnonate aldolase RhmA/quercetin dioxygenase-like cupin family protein